MGRYLHAAALVAHTFTTGIASPKRRYLISRLAREANYRERPLPLVPTVPTGLLTSDNTSVILPVPEGVEGNVSLLELLVLARLVRERAPRHLFEIGTFNGRTTITLAANSPSDAIVHTLDLPPQRDTRFQVESKEREFMERALSGELIHSSAHSGKIHQLHGDSATFDFSSVDADFVFIDGSHAYDYVRNDSERALSMVRGRVGTVVWHDYGEWEGVTRALNELFTSDPRFSTLKHIRGTTLAILEIAAPALTSTRT